MSVRRTGRLDVFDLLWKNGASATVTDAHGMTALMFTALYNSIDIMKRILELVNGTVNTIDKMGRTALHWAIVLGHNEAVSILVGFAETNCGIFDSRKETPLHLAASKGNDEVVDLLIRKIPKAQLSIICTTRSRKGFVASKLADKAGYTNLSSKLLELENSFANSKDKMRRSSFKQPGLRTSTLQTHTFSKNVKSKTPNQIKKETQTAVPSDFHDDSKEHKYFRAQCEKERKNLKELELKVGNLADEKRRLTLHVEKLRNEALKYETALKYNGDQR